ncbi:prepilin-type N-terminal cleavage/methylation domain-containing protein [Ruminococcus albus]|uniref:Prepilin-type cleavage/methylation N-terminal domain protein n=2 Tax=Ruminococcus albus TaxID=1264 RepID=E9SDT7_RUMAL|nr:prepilin-type N-terminal cleavage/methylation domain-containing protein [Ruminococcus albus]AAC79845.1 cellulose-binding protein CbpC precursor [Ruminococcus albus 8]EGC02583.1 prepilin-type cleavage/methylation N-terminal domain protein [Ruminococcus albus 8]MCC3350186.1 prepilin-type N-terminal cleavage/methylation domain-containing protein [Ruminococcus albus 8]
MKNSNKKGFTLVELVVVIAIIGVLAAILVPSMMGYVKKSRLKTANGNAKTAYNTAAGALADLETNGIQLETIDITQNCTTPAASVPDLDGDTVDGVAYVTAIVQNALAANGNDGGEVYINGNTTATGVWGAQWHRKSGDKIVGQYPEAPSTVEKAEAMKFGELKLKNKA